MNRRKFLVIAATGSLIAMPVFPTLAQPGTEQPRQAAHPALPDNQIAEILSEATGSGSFSEVVTRADGRVVTYRFALATGMGSRHYAAQYEKHFQEELPDWVSLEHPYHQILLCQVAVDNNLPLPDRCPDVARSES